MSHSSEELEQPQEDYWSERIMHWQNSGLRQMDYCVQHNLDYLRFRRWRTLLNKKETAKSRTIEFTELKRKPIECIGGIPLQLILPNGVKLLIPTSLKQEHLSLLLQAAGGLTC